MPSRQCGFTLVEIAIVLVIIGLLLGGVIKGQEIIQGARAKAIAAEFRNLGIMLATYQDRFRALPGDDAGAARLLGGGARAGNGNGRIEGSWNSTEPTDEASQAWVHLRLADLAPGPLGEPGSGLWEPRNPDGGRVGLQSDAPFAGMRGRLFACQENISGRVARQVDMTLDDGLPDEGRVRFGESIGNAASEIVDETSYVLCSSV